MRIRAGKNAAFNVRNGCPGALPTEPCQGEDRDRRWRFYLVCESRDELVIRIDTTGGGPEKLSYLIRYSEISIVYDKISIARFR